MTSNFKKSVKQNVVGYLYIAPVLLGVLIFTALPVAYAFISSFFESSMRPFSLTEWGNFVGLQNYTKNFSTYYYRVNFLQSLKVTFGYAVIYIPLSLVLSFLLALLLNQKLKGIRVFRVLIYLPVMLPAVCSGLLWNRITDPNWGLINGLLSNIGLPAFSWFDKPETSMASFIFIQMFTLGGSMILWLAQMNNVPETLYESARLDGAGRLKQLFHVTIPICTPMILYNIIMSIIGVMQTYAQVVTLTGGAGKEYSLLFYVMNIYNYRISDFGLACALGFILFLIIGGLTLVSMKTSKWVYYGEES